jgi:hypothetical protein
MVSTERHGDLLMSGTRNPFTDGSRALAALGYPDETRIGMCHPGKPVSLTATIGGSRHFVSREKPRVTFERFNERQWTGPEGDD